MSPAARPEPSGGRTPDAGGPPAGAFRTRAHVAHRGLRRGLTVRAALAFAAAAVLFAAGVAMTLHAITPHTFPPFVPGGGPTVIVGFSGPWLAAAIGVGAVAGLLLVSAVTDLWRRHLIGRHLLARGRSARHPADGDPATAATRLGQ